MVEQPQWRGLWGLAVFFLQQNIELVFGRVGHPQTQGKIERFHRTLARSMTRQGWPAHWEQWQEHSDGFVRRYNEVRPPEALGLARPAERYRVSARRYRAEIGDWNYPAGLEVSRVDGRGRVRVAGRWYWVCEALVGQAVALERVEEQVLVRYRRMYLREINPAARTTVPFVYPICQVTGDVSPLS